MRLAIDFKTAPLVNQMRQKSDVTYKGDMRINDPLGVFF
jgi:hypothetical protein